MDIRVSHQTEQVLRAAIDKVLDGDEDDDSIVAVLVSALDEPAIDAIEDAFEAHVDEVIGAAVEEWRTDNIDELFDQLVDRLGSRGISVAFETEVDGSGDEENSWGWEANPEDHKAVQSASASARSSRNVLVVLLGAALVVLCALVGVFWVRSARQRQADELFLSVAGFSEVTQPTELEEPVITSSPFVRGSSSAEIRAKGWTPSPAILPRAEGESSHVVSAESGTKLLTVEGTAKVAALGAHVYLAHERRDARGSTKVTLSKVGRGSQQPVPLLEDLDPVRRLFFADDQHILVQVVEQNPATPVLFQVPLAGGGMARIANDAEQVAWNDGSFFVASSFTRISRRQIADVSIRRLPRDGDGAVTTLYQDLPPVRALRVHGTKLVWIGREPASAPQGQLAFPRGYLAIAPSGGRGQITVKLFDEHRPRGLQVDDEAIYVLTEGTLANRLDDAMVLRIPHGSDGSWQVLASGQSLADDFVLTGSHLCWHSAHTEDYGYSVRCVPTSGGDVVEVGAGAGPFRSLAAQGTKLLWVAGSPCCDLFEAQVPPQ